MEERLQESLSALMDNETNELELERLLKQAADGDVRATWLRMQGARAALRGDAEAGVFSLEFADRVSAALAQSPAAAASGRLQTLVQPLTSFAVAASVFAAVLVGSQFYSLAGVGSGAAGEQQVADQVSAPGLVYELGGVATQASFGQRSTQLRPVAATVSYDQVARQRLQRYLVPHTDAASLNAPQGMMPYARVASFANEDQD